MTHTPNLLAMKEGLGKLRSELTGAEDDLLELRNREKALAALNREDDQNIGELYGMEN